MYFGTSVIQISGKTERINFSEKKTYRQIIIGMVGAVSVELLLTTEFRTEKKVYILFVVN